MILPLILLAAQVSIEYLRFIPPPPKPDIYVCSYEADGSVFCSNLDYSAHWLPASRHTDYGEIVGRPVAIAPQQGYWYGYPLGKIGVPRSKP